MLKANLLLLEDDASLLELLQEELEEHYCVVACQTLKQALQQLDQQEFDCIVSDIRLPDGSGLSLLPRIKQLSNQPAVLIITAFGTVQQAVKALQEGADDFLTKPLDIEHFILTVQRLIDTRSMKSELNHYKQLFKQSNFYGLIGESPAMQKLFQHIRQIATADGPVLIQGESGTGKELVARALHDLSDRRDAPYLVVNCGGIPSELMESEFFGHSAGAFTGAKQQRAGLFQQAQGGTLVLDELGEMPLAMQAKLLRVLQDGKVRPVGSDKEIQLDVRVLAATNRNLSQAMAEGSFREDLFYRLETFQIQLPALKNRGRDSLILAEYFLARYNTRQGQTIKGFSDEVIEVFLYYAFPGNVRELQNAVERAAVFCIGSIIQLEHLPQRMRAKDVFKQESDLSVDITPEPCNESLLSLAEVQKNYIHTVLEKTAGNKRKAAEILGITRRTLYRWLDN